MKRRREILIPLGLAAALALTVVPNAEALTIVPTYLGTLASDATSMATINSAIQQYQTTFNDPITVRIDFQNINTGLGQSSTFIQQFGYAQYRTALIADATSADDATANATLPNQVPSPVDGNTNMWLTLANARSVGLLGNSASTDATIGLNFSIINKTRPPGDNSKYDLQAVAQHEIDEVLGLGSGLNLPVNFPRLSRPQDLFRYNGAGSRSFSTSNAEVSYLSIDGGTTNLVGFNQTGNGDFGDWVNGSGTTRVQDAFGTPGSTPNLGVELRNLDVIGYTLAAQNPPVGTPEPSTIVLVATALPVGLGIWWRKRRRVSA